MRNLLAVLFLLLPVCAFAQSSNVGDQTHEHAAGEIALAEMASSSVDSDNIVDDTIANADMADNSIDSDDYVDGSIDTAHFAAGSVDAAAIGDQVKSMQWGAGAMTADGTQCADAAAVTINSGPKIYTIICTDNDASIMKGSTVMPDGWDAGTVTFELAYIQTAADTSAMNADVSAACRGAGETVNSTLGTEVAIDDAALTGSNAMDYTTSAAVTPDGTCAAGDILFWSIALDATGTTTAVSTLHFTNVKMEYTWNSED